MDEPKQAEVVTIKEAVEKVKNWIAEKDFEKAKQGCEEILAVETDNAEVKELLEQAKAGLGGAPEPAPETPTPAPTPTPTPVPEVKEEVKEVVPEPEVEPEPAQTPDMIMKPKKEEKKEEPKKEEEPKPATPVTKKHFPIGKLILIIALIAIAGGLVFAYIQGWLNPAFEWILGLLGM